MSESVVLTNGSTASNLPWYLPSFIHFSMRGDGGLLLISLDIWCPPSSPQLIDNNEGTLLQAVRTVQIPLSNDQKESHPSVHQGSREKSTSKFSSKPICHHSPKLISSSGVMTSTDWHIEPDFFSIRSFIQEDIVHADSNFNFRQSHTIKNHTLHQDCMDKLSCLTRSKPRSSVRSSFRLTMAKHYTILEVIHYTYDPFSRDLPLAFF